MALISGGGGGGSSPTLRAITHADSPVAAVAASIYMCDASGGNIAVTLPTPADGDSITFKKSDGGNAVVSFTSAALIDPLGVLTAQPKITDFEAIGFVGYNGVWRITAEPGLNFWRGGAQVLGPGDGAVYFSDSVSANDSGSGLYWNGPNDVSHPGQLFLLLGSGGDDAVFFGPNAGDVWLFGLPTADPHNAGKLWNSTGTLKVSAG